MLKKEHMSIISYVLWRVLPLTMALMLSIWLATRWVTQRAIDHEVSERLNHEAKLVAQSIDARLAFLTDTVKNLAINDLVINSLIDTTARDQYLPPFFQSMRISGLPKAHIALVDYRGRIIAANVSAGAPAGYETAGWLAMVMNGQMRVEISSDGMQIVAPVRYSGLVEGALVVSAGAADALDLLQTLSATVDYAVIDQTRQAVMYSSAPSLGERGQPYPAASAARRRQAAHALAAFPFLVVHCSEKSLNFIGRFSKLDVFLFGAMLLDLVALFCGVALCARLIAGPLSQFSHQLSRLQHSGDLKQRIIERGPTEFRMLVRAFNDLFERLRQTTVSRDHLEHLVKARTNELKNTQKKLVHQALEAGRAQIAAMVMHNIGNAITPVQVQLDCLQSGESRVVVDYLRQCLLDLQANQHRLTEYIQSDSRGQKVFALMGNLVESLEKEEARRLTMVSGMQQATAHISEILSLQQAYSLADQEQRQQTDLNQLIVDALRMQRSALEKRSIGVEKKMAADLPKLLIDKNRLIQVIVNLIKNSYEAIDQVQPGRRKPLICIESAPHRGGVRFRIQDNGVGIEAARLENVFQYGQSSKGTSGFGLYYCKMFIENNHGELRLQSAGLGLGAEIVITFAQSAMDRDDR